MTNAAEQTPTTQGGRKTEGVDRSRRSSHEGRASGRASAYVQANALPAEIDEEVGSTPVKLRAPEGRWSLLIVTDDFPLQVNYKHPDDGKQQTTLEPFHGVTLPPGTTSIKIHATEEPTQVTTRLYENSVAGIVFNAHGNGDNVNTSAKAKRSRQQYWDRKKDQQ